jgi:hypothetical protein
VLNQIEIELTEKTDKNGDSYYVGGSNIPLILDNQVSIFIFHPDEETGENPKLVIRKNRRPPGTPSRSGSRSRDDYEDQDQD